MRPFLEIYISRESKDTKASKVTLFNPNDESAVLNDRLISFRFEESDGDDIELKRKGKKDILTFTFLDKVSEDSNFISDSGLIKIRDLVFVTYGWVLDNNETKIVPDLIQREFRIVKLESNFSNVDTVTVTAFDRSVDLDIGAVSHVFIPTEEQRPTKVTFKTVLQSIAQQVGLELDDTSRVILNEGIFINERVAIANETIASYLKYLAEETGSIFFVENRKLFFGARKLPKVSEVSVTLNRGMVDFDVSKRKDFEIVPIVELDIDRKMITETILVSVQSQNLRTAEVTPVILLAKELSQLLVLIDSILGFKKPAEKAPISRSQVPLPIEQAGPVLPLTPNQQQELDDTTFVNAKLDEFFQTPRVFKREEITSDIIQMSPSSREGALQAIVAQKMADLIAKEITASVKIIGNPIVRRGQLAKLDGNLPDTYKGVWYIQSVEHAIDGRNYFTTLKLMAGSPDNPFTKENISELKKQVKNQNKPTKTNQREILKPRTAR